MSGYKSKCKKKIRSVGSGRVRKERREQRWGRKSRDFWERPFNLHHKVVFLSRQDTFPPETFLFLSGWLGLQHGKYYPWDTNDRHKNGRYRREGKTGEKVGSDGVIQGAWRAEKKEGWKDNTKGEQQILLLDYLWNCSHLLRSNLVDSVAFSSLLYK